MMKAKTGFLLLAGLVSAPVVADQRATDYIGFQVAEVTYGEDGSSVEVTPTALVGRFGHYYSRHFSLEGRVGFGVEDDSFTLGGVTHNLDVDHLVGLYGVGHVPFGIASVYVLAGATSVQLSVDSVTDEDSGFSYGAGVEINLGRKASLTVEYTSYLKKSGFHIDTIGAGANFKF